MVLNKNGSKDHENPIRLYSNSAINMQILEQIQLVIVYSLRDKCVKTRANSDVRTPTHPLSNFTVFLRHWNQDEPSRLVPSHQLFPVRNTLSCLCLFIPFFSPTCARYRFWFWWGMNVILTTGQRRMWLDGGLNWARGKWAEKRKGWS